MGDCIVRCNPIADSRKDPDDRHAGKYKSTVRDFAISSPPLIDRHCCKNPPVALTPIARFTQLHHQIHSDKADKERPFTIEEG